MKKTASKYIYALPMLIWIVIIPLIVKRKKFDNPLSNYDWYSTDATGFDFFLYYKSVFIILTGICMIAFLCWQILKMKDKESLLNRNTRIFLPIVAYLILAVFSSMFSAYKYFCVHGIADQFESIWCLIAYVAVVFYGYYLIAYQNAERDLSFLIYAGAVLVGTICVLQYFGIDIYRLIYAGKGYSFTFDIGTVYGPFYNTNYVGYYSLLFAPLFILSAIVVKNWKVRFASIILAVILLISMFGAKSVTAIFAFAAVAVFAVFYILLKHTRTKKVLWLPVLVIALGCVGVMTFIMPKVRSYIQASDTKKTNLENIYTEDRYVELDYKGEKLFIQMTFDGTRYDFNLLDENSYDIMYKYMNSPEGYYYYEITDEPFSGMTLTPMLLSEDPEIYGFSVFIDDKDWIFTNQASDDGTYYYFNCYGRVVKLTSENVSDDFKPLINKSSLASGRGYIWNKTIALLKNYILLGSGADTFTIVYPNNDYVGSYNNGYDNMIVTKPHNLYLQIAVQSGVLSLICFVIFYLWYFISSLKLYFTQKIDNLLPIMGFSIMLGTLGYMISGIATDSTVAVSPLYWAMMGIGIGINHKIKMKPSHEAM